MPRRFILYGLRPHRIIDTRVDMIMTLSGSRPDRRAEANRGAGTMYSGRLPLPDCTRPACSPPQRSTLKCNALKSSALNCNAVKCNAVKCNVPGWSRPVIDSSPLEWQRRAPSRHPAWGRGAPRSTPDSTLPCVMSLRAHRERPDGRPRGRRARWSWSCHVMQQVTRPVSTRRATRGLACRAAWEASSPSGSARSGRCRRPPKRYRRARSPSSTGTPDRRCFRRPICRCSSRATTSAGAGRWPRSREPPRAARAWGSQQRRRQLSAAPPSNFRWPWLSLNDDLGAQCAGCSQRLQDARQLAR